MGERLGVWALEQGGRTSATALALLGVVSLFADPAGVCILTPTDLQARAGLNKSSFTQALAELLKAGLISTQETTTGTAFSVLAPREYLDDTTLVSAAGELERGLRIISTTLTTTTASGAGTAGTAGTDHAHTTPAHIKVADPLTNDGLARILAYLEECGWGDQEVIGRLLIAIEARTRSRLAFLIKHNSPLGFREVLGDVCARVWEIIRTQTRDVIGAEFGWAYVLRAATRQYEKNTPANTHELLPGDEACLDTDETEVAGDYEHGTSRVLLDDVTSWNAGAQFLIGELVARGVDQGLAWHAMRRVLEICARWGFQSRFLKARDDRELARLGLSAQVIGAWMGLVSGSRREGEEGSFLLGFARGRRTFTRNEEARLKRIVTGTRHSSSDSSSLSVSGLEVAS